MSAPTFVFMDESGRRDSDRFFVCGFLEIVDNQTFSQALQRVVDQIRNVSIRNRQNRVELLKAQNDVSSLYNLAKSYNEFELKHYHISNENKRLYADLVKAVFHNTNFRFTAIVADRHDPNYIRDPIGQLPLYLKAFKMFTTRCIKAPDYIFAPDSFEPGFDWNVKSGILPLAILPLDSKSCVQLQVCDIVSGLVGQALKLVAGEPANNKDLIRQEVLQALEKGIGRKITGNLTVNKPCYFSIWIIDWGKSKGRGMDKKPNPDLKQL